MKLGISGYGRMGKLIARMAEERGHEIVHILDKPEDGIQPAEAYIDFSLASALHENLPAFCQQQIPLVIGTTGWQEQQKDYTALFEKHQNTGIWSGNFSLGVNLFWQAVGQTAAQFASFSEEYDPMIHEFHHKHKIDSPSGTALKTAHFLMEAFPKKKRIVTQALQRGIESDELHVSSTRGGTIPGTHSVLFDSLFDTIEIKHTARSREGFALGAILAAEKIHELPSGLHDFSALFNQLF